MEIKEIIGSPGRYVLHKAGIFHGEGWLLGFKMWPVLEPHDGVICCNVDLGDVQTNLWFVYAEVDDLLKDSQVRAFVVGSRETMTRDGSAEVLVFHALVVVGKVIKCYGDEASALRAAKIIARRATV